jgi:hypothetical protein
MRLYTNQHRFYCGVDLHARTLSPCVLDSTGAHRPRSHSSAGARPATRRRGPYLDGLVVGCECLFAGTGSPTDVPSTASRSCWVTPSF